MRILLLMTPMKAQVPEVLTDLDNDSPTDSLLKHLVQNKNQPCGTAGNKNSYQRGEYLPCKSKTAHPVRPEIGEGSQSHKYG